MFPHINSSTVSWGDCDETGWHRLAKLQARKVYMWFTLYRGPRQSCEFNL